MKQKFLVTLLSFTLAFAFIGCGEKAETKANDTVNTNELSNNVATESLPNASDETNNIVNLDSKAIDSNFPDFTLSSYSSKQVATCASKDGGTTFSLYEDNSVVFVQDGKEFTGYAYYVPTNEEDFSYMDSWSFFAANYSQSGEVEALVDGYIFIEDGYINPDLSYLQTYNDKEDIWNNFSDDYVNNLKIRAFIGKDYTLIVKGLFSYSYVVVLPKNESLEFYYDYDYSVDYAEFNRLDAENKLTSINYYKNDYEENINQRVQLHLNYVGNTDKNINVYTFYEEVLEDINYSENYDDYTYDSGTNDFYVDNSYDNNYQGGDSDEQVLDERYNYDPTYFDEDGMLRLEVTGRKYRFSDLNMDSLILTVDDSYFAEPYDVDLLGDEPVSVSAIYEYCNVTWDGIKYIYPHAFAKRIVEVLGMPTEYDDYYMEYIWRFDNGKVIIMDGESDYISIFNTEDREVFAEGMG